MTTIRRGALEQPPCGKVTPVKAGRRKGWSKKAGSVGRGAARFGRAAQGWSRQARRGPVRQDRATRGGAGRGRLGLAWPCVARPVLARRVEAGAVRPVSARLGSAWPRLAYRGRQRMAWRGWARRGEAERVLSWRRRSRPAVHRKSRPVGVRRVWSTQARRGLSRLGASTPVVAGRDRRGCARQGWFRQCPAGRGRHGNVSRVRGRHGESRHVPAGQCRQARRRAASEKVRPFFSAPPRPYPSFA
jgi:hypothetical protein